MTSESPPEAPLQAALSLNCFTVVAHASYCGRSSTSHRPPHYRSALSRKEQVAQFTNSASPTAFFDAVALRRVHDEQLLLKRNSASLVLEARCVCSSRRLLAVPLRLKRANPTMAMRQCSCPLQGQSRPTCLQCEIVAKNRGCNLGEQPVA